MKASRTFADKAVPHFYPWKASLIEKQAPLDHLLNLFDAFIYMLFVFIFNLFIASDTDKMKHVCII